MSGPVLVWSPARRLGALVVAVAAAGVAALTLPLSRVPEAVAGLGPGAPVVGVLVGVALLAALVPRTPISLACGALFGAVAGPLVSITVMLLAATLTFIAGRRLGQEYFARRLGQRWATLTRWVHRDGILTVAAVRAVPLAPYGLMGYAYGASPVRARDYFIGSFAAGTPSAITYALVGAAVMEQGNFNVWLYLPLAISAVLTVIVLVRARAFTRAGGRGSSPRP